MAIPSLPFIYTLPDEMLLQVAGYLDGQFRYALLALALVSRNIRPIAQEVLCRSPVFQAHNGEPNRSLKFLRAVILNPTIALKVRRLSLHTIHRDIRYLCTGAVPTGIDESNMNQPFETGLSTLENADKKDWLEMQRICKAKMSEMGVDVEDEWYKKIDDWSESAFGGLLLMLLPKLEDLEMTVYDRRVGIVYHSPIEALFGTAESAASASLTFGLLERLSIPGKQLKFLALEYPKLTTLRLDEVGVTRVYETRGQDSWARASQIKHLEIEIPLLSTRLQHFNNFHFSLDELLVATGWRLTSVGFEITKKRPGFGPEISTIYYDMSQLIHAQVGRLAPTLEELVLRVHEDDKHADYDWILNHSSPVQTLQPFFALKRLVIEQRFLINSETQGPLSTLLPSSLEELAIVAPTEQILDWLKELPYNLIAAKAIRPPTASSLVANGMFEYKPATTADMLPEFAPISADSDTQKYFFNLKEITLRCPYEVNTPADFFWDHEHPLWEDLNKCGVTGHVHCEITGERRVLDGSSRDKEVRGICVQCDQRCGNTQYYVIAVDDVVDDDEAVMDIDDDSEMEDFGLVDEDELSEIEE